MHILASWTHPGPPMGEVCFKGVPKGGRRDPPRPQKGASEDEETTKARNTAPVRCFYEGTMFFSTENIAFSVIILTILKKRSKRLTIFGEIAAFPSEKMRKSAGERLTRTGWKRQTLQLFNSKHAALLKLHQRLQNRQTLQLFSSKYAARKGWKRQTLQLFSSKYAALKNPPRPQNDKPYSCSLLEWIGDKAGTGGGKHSSDAEKHIDR